MVNDDDVLGPWGGGVVQSMGRMNNVVQGQFLDGFQSSS